MLKIKLAITHMKIAFSIADLVFDALAYGCFSNRCIAILLV